MEANARQEIENAAERLVDVRTLDREEWLRWRMRGIGGSDAAGVMGLSPFSTPLSVYFDKVQFEASEPTIAQEVGIKLEPYVRRKFVKWIAEVEGIEIQVKKEHHILQHPEHPWMIANLDGYFYHPKLNCICLLECKTTSAFMADEWDEETLPDGYYIQVQHCLAVTGWKFAYVAYLVGNNKFGAMVIPRNEEVIASIIEQEKNFWENHVQTNIPPAPIGHRADAQILKNLYGDTVEEGKTIDLEGEEWQDLYDEYKELVKQVKEINQCIDTIKQKIMAQMKDAETAFIGRKKATWKLQHRKGYTVEPSVSRVFRIW